jgi:cytochrome c oxidase accessory protein FixG
MIKDGPANHISTLISLLIFTGIFYFIFVWFREQVCIIACPYGRLQAVLLDDKSINVAYDFARGDKVTGRAKFSKQEERAQLGKGDCIDCKQCLKVCPTGIDIRNGTQMECINCTACIDECDTIMDKVGLPRGLIRYASEDEIKKNVMFKFTTRMKGYAAVLFLLIGILVSLLFLRTDVEATILRLPGQLFQHKGDNISNIYTFKIINKTNSDFQDISFKLVGTKGTLNIVGKQNLKVPKQGKSSGTLFVEINQNLLASEKTKLKIEVYDGDRKIETSTTSFLSPRSFD